MNKSSCDPLFFVRPVFISLGSLALCDFNMWRLRTLTYSRPNGKNAISSRDGAGVSTSWPLNVFFVLEVEAARMSHLLTCDILQLVV